MKYKKIIVVIVVITICFGITFFNIKKNEKVDIDEVHTFLMLHQR